MKIKLEEVTAQDVDKFLDQGELQGIADKYDLTITIADYSIKVDGEPHSLLSAWTAIEGTFSAPVEDRHVTLRSITWVFC